MFISRSEHCDELSSDNIMSLCTNSVKFGNIYSDISKSEKTEILRVNFASFYNNGQEIYSEAYLLMQNSG